MRRIDYYAQHLMRHNAREVELRSGKPVRFVFPTGDRSSRDPIDHREIETLVREAAPPAAIESLQRDRVAAFKYASAGVRLEVKVEERADAEWRVVLIPRRGGTPGPDTLRRPGTSPGVDVTPNRANQAPFERPVGGAMAGAAIAGAALGAASTSSATGPEPEARSAASAPRARDPGIVAGEPEIHRYLRHMVGMGASDLHLSSTVKPMLRHDGEMKEMEGEPPLEPERLEKLLQDILPDRNKGEFAETHDTDFAHPIEGLARFRANYFMDRKGPGAVFRQIPYEILTTEKLGLPQGVIDLCWLSKGLVLVTGPTGSGKSTTLAALVDYINRNRSDHIITIEDPVEFVHENKKCLINQREVGVHTKSFKSALRAALREDPDIVLVGEMRDLETISIAIETAETGHLVFGTLHTTSAKSTVDRIIDQFPTDQQEQIRVMLSESLRGVIAQVLCKKKGGGRIAGLEVMITNPAVSNLIREGKTFQLTSVMQTGRNLGMMTMNDHLLEHVKKGVVDAQEAFVKSNDKLSFRDALKRLNIQLDL